MPDDFLNFLIGKKPAQFFVQTTLPECLDALNNRMSNIVMDVPDWFLA